MNTLKEYSVFFEHYESIKQKISEFLRPVVLLEGPQEKAEPQGPSRARERTEPINEGFAQER